MRGPRLRHDAARKGLGLLSDGQWHTLSSLASRLYDLVTDDQAIDFLMKGMGSRRNEVAGLPVAEKARRGRTMMLSNAFSGYVKNGRVEQRGEKGRYEYRLAPPPAPEFRLVRIDEIVVGERARKSLGDIQKLAESMKARLIHPIALADGNVLVAGFRRLEAAKLLGWTKIPATIHPSIRDALAFRTTEYEENVCRKRFTPAEARALYEQILPLEKDRAKGRKREGQRHGAATTNAKKKGDSLGATVAPSDSDKVKARDLAAQAVGYSHEAMRQVGEIQEAARKEPERFGHLAAQLDGDEASIRGLFEQYKAIREDWPRPPEEAPPPEPVEDEAGPDEPADEPEAKDTPALPCDADEEPKGTPPLPAPAPQPQICPTCKRPL